MGWVSRSFLLAAVVVSMPAVPVYAEKSTAKKPQGKLWPAYEKCLNTGEARMGVMPAMFDCDREELSRQNDVLNATYRTVRRDLIPAKQKQLQDLERRWIAQRDKKCNAQADEAGGQDGTLVWYGCMIAETEQRIAWLKDFARKT